MIQHLPKLLGDRDGEREFERAMAGNIRADNFIPMQDYLRKGLIFYQSEFAPICNAITPASVRLTGWENIYKEIVRYNGSATPCTAIGIDLTSHWDGPEPGFEISYYAQDAFKTQSRAAILAECQNYGTVWQGCFMECGYGLELKGLSDLYAALKSFEATDACNWRYNNKDAVECPLPVVGYHQARWYLYAVVHEAIARDIAGLGLPAPMPVIVSEHDFGPWVASVHMSTKIAQHNYNADVMKAAELSERIAGRLAQTEKNIVEFTEQRALIRSWGYFFRNPAKRSYIDLCESSFRLKLVHTDLAKVPAPWKQSDWNYNRFLDNYRAMRASKYKAA